MSYNRNVIEGHHTLPHDVEHALHHHFSDEAALRDLQQEALAHIHVQRLIDQVEFMHDLFDMGHLVKRIEKYCYDELVKGDGERPKLSPDAFLLLREAVYRGQFERGKISRSIAGKSAVTARRVLKSLFDRGLLVSDTPRGAVRLAAPTYVLGAWFPNLYPEHALRVPL